MENNAGNPILYVFVRDCLNTMNSGRVAAQVSHATSMLHETARSEPLFKEWKNTTSQGFGTTLVKGTGFFIKEDDGKVKQTRVSWDEIRNSFYMMSDLVKDPICGIVTDPTYAVPDGDDFFHLVECETCIWALLDKKKWGESLQLADDPHSFDNQELGISFVYYLFNSALYRGWN